MTFEHIMAPVDIGRLALRNRVVMPTHGTRLPQARYLPYLAARAEAIGLVGITASAGLYDLAFGPRSRLEYDPLDFDAAPGDLASDDARAFSAAFEQQLREQAAVVRDAGTRSAGQLVHLGASAHLANLQPYVAPSATVDPAERQIPHALTRPEIDRIIESFALAARRVRDAGMDAVEIHGAHGYLVHEFLSPLWNDRTDDYGGSAENRMRFAIEVVRAVRAAVDDELPVGIRLNGSEDDPGGLTADDMATIAHGLEGEGIAYVSVSGGNYTGEGLRTTGRAYVTPAPAAMPVNAADAAVIHEQVSVPVIVTGRVLDLETADRLVADGVADLVGFVRALIADERLVQKSLAGQSDHVRQCIGGNECHYPGRPVTCAINPSAGREREAERVRTREPRRVVVIGGGPAGCEAAKTAATRGHQVVLLDRGDALGGTLRFLTRARSEYARYVAQLAQELDGSSVEIRLGVDASADFVRALDPDAVIVATGASEFVPSPTLGSPRATTALPVLTGELDLGERVVVVAAHDDHMGPLLVAAEIAKRARVTHLVAEPMSIGAGADVATQVAAVRALLDIGVVLEPMTRFEEMSPDGPVFVHTLTGARRVVPADTVVFAGTRRANSQLADSIARWVPDVRVVGDALAPRRLLHATLEGFRAGLAV